MQLLRPQFRHLESYVAALRRHWSADNMLGPDAAKDELRQIESDPAAFLASMDDRETTGPLVKLPDGTAVKRIPGFRRWMWDSEFCGSIGLRWQPDTTRLPPYCLGHIGFSVVPWKRQQGMATQALGCVLPEAWTVGLAFVELVTSPENVASQRVIEANGGILFEEFVLPPQYESKLALRYRVFRPKQGD